MQKKLTELQVEWKDFIDHQYKIFLDENYQLDLAAFMVDYPDNPKFGLERWRKKRQEWENKLSSLAKDWWGNHDYIAEFKGLQGSIKQKPNACVEGRG